MITNYILKRKACLCDEMNDFVMLDVGAHVIDNGNKTFTITQNDNVYIVDKFGLFNVFDDDVHGIITSDDLIVNRDIELLEEIKINALKFSTRGTSRVKLQRYGTSNPHIEISFDGNEWRTYDFDDIQISENDVLYMRGQNATLSSSSANYVQFIMSGDLITCQGNIMHLLSHENDITIVPQYCFCNLFMDCDVLERTPDMPATNVAKNAYQRMYQNCTSLTTSCELPFTTVGQYACESMFRNCTSLIESTKFLPAIDLQTYSYRYMYQNCSSLIDAPNILAQSLLIQACRSMFDGCTSLQNADMTLKSTSLAQECYWSMFAGCKSLKRAPKIEGINLAIGCYKQMFYGCSSLTDAPQLSATTLMNQCYKQMFYSCTSLVIAPQLPATTLAQECYYYMFHNCQSLVESPILSATSLAQDCYTCLFNKCTSLKTLTCLYENDDLFNYTTNWMNGVFKTGTFYKSANATWTDEIRDASHVMTNWDVQIYNRAS